MTERERGWTDTDRQRHKYREIQADRQRQAENQREAETSRYKQIHAETGR